MNYEELTVAISAIGDDTAGDGIALTVQTLRRSYRGPCRPLVGASSGGLFCGLVVADETEGGRNWYVGASSILALSYDKL